MSVAVRCPFCRLTFEHADNAPLADRQVMTCPACGAQSGYDLRWSRYIGKADLAANIAPEYAKEARRGGT